MSLPSWLANPDAGFLNSVSWRISALMAGALAVIAVYLHQGKILPEESAPVPAHLTPTGPPREIAVAEEAVQPVTDHQRQRRIDFCSRHVTADRSFVVFKNGTCVLVNEPDPDPIGTAVDLIRRCSAPEARFITHRIEADCYMITYEEPIFHCLFADEVAQLAPVVNQSFTRFLTPSERRAQPSGWEPPFDAKLGLVARTFLNADARDQRVAKVIRALPVPAVEEHTAQADLGPPRP